MPFSGFLLPYANNIDSGTPKGIKLSQRAVAIDCSDDERLVIKMENSTAVINSLNQDSNAFCYGSTVHAVTTKFGLYPDPTWQPPTPTKDAAIAFAPLVLHSVSTGSILLNSSVHLVHVLLDSCRAKGTFTHPKLQAELEAFLAISAIDFKVAPTTTDAILYKRVCRKMIGEWMMNIVNKDTQ